MLIANPFAHNTALSYYLCIQYNLKRRLVNGQGICTGIIGGSKSVGAGSLMLDFVIAEPGTLGSTRCQRARA